MPEVSQSCAHCGTDVRNARRFKDAAGHLFCSPCAEKLRSHSAGAQQSEPVSKTARNPEDGTIALADEPDFKPHAPAHSPYADLELCPDCGTPFGSGPVCLSCGHDRRTGDTIGRNVPPPAGEPLSTGLPTPAKPPKPCIQCGYDLRGLKTARCPECGTLNPRLKRGQQSIKQQLREMYVKPLIMVGVGLAIATLVYLIFGVASVSTRTGFAGIASALFYLASYAIWLPIGFVTYVVCSMMFIGFDEPLWITFIRLAGVFAVTDACYAGLFAVIGPFAWPIAGVVYVGLLMSVMELELTEAWLVAAITYFAKVATWLVAVYIYIRYF